MDTSRERMLALLKWYEESARGFFLDFRPPEKVAELDKDKAHLLKHLESFNTQLAVCFLGGSGVGKSTLLNAIVDGSQAIVPSGGVGPLTAQALVVRYGDVPRLEVEYHGVPQIWRTIFGLEQTFRTELGIPREATPVIDMVEGLTESDLPPAEPASIEVDESGNTATAMQDEQRQLRRRRAQLLVTGDQNEERDLKYLLDFLRVAVGNHAIWETPTTWNGDGVRLRGIQEALSLAQGGKHFELEGSINDPDFALVVQDHATGYLAPLIKKLTIHWPSDVLKSGLTLVDLPGVGVVNDVHKDITRDWIRKRAGAVVLVVDHRGITEPVANALHHSEFLNSLLYSVDDPAEDPILMVAVTRVDDIANSNYLKDHTKKKYQHFIEVGEEIRNRLRMDLQRELGRIWLNKDEVTDTRRKIIDNLLTHLEVHPVSAIEYARFRIQDSDDASFLKDARQSGLPGFIESMQAQVTRKTQRLLDHLTEQTDVFRDRLFSMLDLIEAQWEPASRVDQEIESLRSELALFLEAPRKELYMRQGAYREYLKATIPHRIQDLVETSLRSATYEINKYLRNLGEAHWNTLRASVRRGGSYSGARAIDLPNEFALRCEEPVAEAWSKNILNDLRIHTREYGSDCVKISDDLVNWALKQGGRVQAKAVKAQQEALKSKARKFDSVGKDMVKEMRQEARGQLVVAIERPIRKRCEEFVKKKKDIGPGVKQRILDLYKELAEEVALVARDPSCKLLKSIYKDAEDEIGNALTEFQDPLTPIADVILNTQQSDGAQINAQKHHEVIARIKSVRAVIPSSLQAIS